MKEEDRPHLDVVELGSVMMMAMQPGCRLCEI